MIVLHCLFQVCISFFLTVLDLTAFSPLYHPLFSLYMAFNLMKLILIHSVFYASYFIFSLPFPLVDFFDFVVIVCVLYKGLTPRPCVH
jgi:hypothetical protein